MVAEAGEPRAVPLSIDPFSPAKSLEDMVEHPSA